MNGDVSAVIDARPVYTGAFKTLNQMVRHRAGYSGHSCNKSGTSERRTCVEHAYRHRATKSRGVVNRLAQLPQFIRQLRQHVQERRPTRIQSGFARLPITIRGDDQIDWAVLEMPATVSEPDFHRRRHRLIHPIRGRRPMGQGLPDIAFSKRVLSFASTSLSGIALATCPPSER